MSANLVLNDDKKPLYYKFDKLLTREKLDLSIVLGPRVFGLELKGKNTMAQRSKNLTIDGSIALISTTKGQVKPKAVSTPHRFSQKTNK